MPFETSPFPYDGLVPATNAPFLDRREGDKRGRSSARGGVYWQDPTYSDRRVLLSVPRRFDPSRPGVVVVYLHGNLATLERDVCRRQGVPRQVAASRLNAVLVAPQLAVDALDSSAGRFWDRGHLRAFLAEAAARLRELTGATGFEAMPVVLVAYSGGYYPALFAAENGGAGERLRGLVLMDALLGEVERFAALIASGGSRRVFLSAYGLSSREHNLALQRLLKERQVAFGEGLPDALRPGSVQFIPAGPETSHADFMTHALGRDPLRAVLDRLPAGGARRSPTRR